MARLTAKKKAMSNSSKHEQSGYEGSLYLLAWGDISERLDVLLMEARHLQTSIIYQLREPWLYKPLRFEENFMWGEGWGKTLESGESEAHFVRQWMPAYPGPQASLQTETKPKTGGVDKLETDLAEAIRRVWFGHGWGRDQRRHYHSLTGLQLLKRLILRDKLFLWRAAHRYQILTGGLTPNPIGQSKFLILRRVVFKRIAGYISRLRDHQTAFSKAMDAGEQYHPRPSIERRREQGIYSDYLADRTRDIATSMHLLLCSLHKVQKEPELFYKSDLTLHRWRHDYSSYANALYDEVSVEGIYQARPAIRYINTSYFMPERPDLQPVIAHEVAHGVLEDWYDDLSPRGLGFRDDSFSLLLIELWAAVSAFDKAVGFPVDGDVEPRSFVRELACDFLASAIKGYAYLYALFLEYFGEGLEAFGSAIGGNLDVYVADHHGAATVRSAHKREWYLRFSVLIAWIERIDHMPEPDTGTPSACRPPEKAMVSELSGMVKTLNEHLDDLVDYQGQFENAKKWGLLAHELTDIVKSCRAAEKVKCWREKRSKDNDDESGNRKNKRELPRFMARLDRKVRDFLYQSLVQQKFESPYKALEEGTDEAFSNRYGVAHTTVPPSSLSGEQPPLRLFRHIFDIPWQCAMFRARDVQISTQVRHSSTAADKSASVLQQFHTDWAMGKDLFELALEFYLRDNESPTHRLRSVIHLFDHLAFWREREREREEEEKREQPGSGESTGDDPSALYDILDEEEIETWFKKPALRYISPHSKTPRTSHACPYADSAEGVLDCLAERKSEWEERIPLGYLHCFSARTLAKVLGEAKQRSDPGLHRLIERVVGLKLKSLTAILHKINKESTRYPGIRGLLTYLKARTGNFPDEKDLPRWCPFGEKSNDTIERSKGRRRQSTRTDLDDEVNQTVIDALSDKVEHLSQNFVGRQFSYFEICRLALAGSYHHRPKRTEGPKPKKSSLVHTNVPMTEVAMASQHGGVCFEHLPVTEKSNKEPEWPDASSYRVLGRYDLLTITKARPLFRSPLPFFKGDEFEGKPVTIEREGLSCGLKASRQKRDRSAEKFPTFFQRREMGIHVKLHDKRIEPRDNERLFAILIVTLQRRTYRLDFLYRLIKAIREPGTGVKEPPCVLEDLGSRFEAQDYLFLTDGWGDLLIMFRAERNVASPDESGPESLGDWWKIQNKVDLDRVFDIQTILYEDFMVDRTELIFTPAALNAAANSTAKRCDDRPYHFQAQLRLMEDRTLVRYNEHIESKITSEIEKEPEPEQEKKNFQAVLSRCGLKGNELILSRIPGRMDYDLRFSLENNSGGQPPDDPVDLFKETANLFRVPQLDWTDITIGKEIFKAGKREPEDS